MFWTEEIMVGLYCTGKHHGKMALYIFRQTVSSELTKIAMTKVKLIGPFIMIYDTSGNI